MKTLSIDEIEQARGKILENARDLIEEAQLLLGHNRFARAYALAHLGCEELAKLPMFLHAATSSIVGSSVDWAKLFKRLRGHSDKILAIILMDFVVDPKANDEADVKRLQEEIRNVRHHNDMKNMSLYAGIAEGVFLRPAEVISREVATLIVRMARRRLRFFEESERLMRGRTAELASSPEYKELRKRFVDPLLSNKSQNREGGSGQC